MKKLIVAAAAPDCRPADIEQNKENILAAIARAKADGASLLLLPMDAVGGFAGALAAQSLFQRAESRALQELLFAAGELQLFMSRAGQSAEASLRLGDFELELLSTDRPATALSDMENEEEAALRSLESGGVCLLASPLGGPNSDNVYTGHCVIAQNGHILAAGEGYVCAALDAALAPITPVEELVTTQPQNPWLPVEGLERRILSLQALGLARRMELARSRKAVLGLSGGLDSTLALLVCAEALKLLGRPASDIVAVTMPCFGTTARTRSNAQIMAEALGADFRTVDITLSVHQHLADIGHASDSLNNAFENAQARERTQVLMDLANDLNGLVVGTGDLSEIALGWCTYNGDHMSMYSVNCGLPKTALRAVLRAYAAECGNSALAAAVTDVLETPVSPELLPAADGAMTQLTEDLVGPYELHDFFLYYFLAYGMEPRQLFPLALETLPQYPRETVLKWLKVFYRRFFAAQFKRSCMPDGPAVLGLSLSPRDGFPLPTNVSPALWLAELEKLQ